MWRKFAVIIAAIWICLDSASLVAAQTIDSVADERPLRIGTMHTPPFCIKDFDGTWSGISIDLWREIAYRLQFEYEFEERTLQELLDGVKNGELDAALAALTVTEDRELVMDFTHPHHSTGFAIATLPRRQSNVWLAVFQQLFSWQFLQVVSLLVLMLLIVGWVMWLVEHKHEGSQEDSHTIRHVSEGLWWAAATMTTVGYGDKTPLTQIGRLLGIIWMFTALMIVASFIAAFSSVLTVHKLETTMHGPRDLAHSRVATVPGSTSELYLERNGITTKTFPTVVEGLRAVARGRVDAMVYDAPLIKYYARVEFPGQIDVSPVTFERQDYGFALPQNSKLREPINQELLRIVRSDDWSKTLDRYLGN
ncbi:MAG: transporter substrate-binding domain-containing protein [Gammaproteobacteria bacterium]|nr:transporter substrate-binding domain-containing protein [Gammaproteobacteria bacterium]